MGGSIGKTIGKVANVASLGVIPANALSGPKLPSGTQPIPQTQQEAVQQFRAQQALRNVPKAGPADANLTFGEWEAMKRANDRPNQNVGGSIPVLSNAQGQRELLGSANSKYRALAENIAGPVSQRPQAYLPGMSRSTGSGKGATTTPAAPVGPVATPKPATGPKSQLGRVGSTIGLVANRNAPKGSSPTAGPQPTNSLIARLRGY